MKYQKYDKFEGMMKRLVGEINQYHWLNKDGIYKINPDNKVVKIDERDFFMKEYPCKFIDECADVPDEIYNLLLKRIKPMKKLKKEKVKKLTKEQKLKQENEALLRTVDDLKERESYLEGKIKAREDDIEEIGEKMNQNAELYQERERQNRREVERLMEIIRWQIKPESALQKDKMEIRGEEGIERGFNPMRHCC